MAGKRKGKEDERHLWPEMLRAIREIKPKYIVGENVFGLLNWNGGLVFDEVHTDLELEGYEVQAVVIPAAAVNAPHGRDRVWFVAYSNGIGNRGESKQPSVTHKQRRGGKTNSGIGSSREQQPLCDITSKGDATYTNSRRLEGAKEIRRDSIDVERESKFGTSSNSNGNERCNIYRQKTSKWRENQTHNGIANNGSNEYATDTLHKGLQGGQKIDRWQKHNEERRANGINIGANGKNINGKFPSDFQNFPTQSPICGGDDGLPTELDGITFSKWRAESIKGYGNAIVPQVALEIFKALEKL